MKSLSLIVTLLGFLVIANPPVKGDVVESLTKGLSNDEKGAALLAGLLTCDTVKPECKAVITNGLIECCKNLKCKSCQQKQCEKAAEALEHGRAQDKDTKTDFFKCFEKKIAENKEKNCEKSNLLGQTTGCLSYLELLKKLGIVTGGTGGPPGRDLPIVGKVLGGLVG